MIQLESLVSDRQALVTMVTNLVASFAETTQVEVQNIGDSSPGTSKGDAGDL